MARDGLEVLEALRGQGWVHGDVAPGNLVAPTGPKHEYEHTVVLDWLPLPPGATGKLFGTIQTMAPERFENAPPTEAGDLYGLGCTFYFALTGKYPFDGASEAVVAANHLAGRYTPLREVLASNAALVRLVDACLSRQPADRPASAREALAMLDS